MGRGKPNKKDDRDESSEEEEYIVEKVVDKRIKGGKVQYLLKWEGYGSDSNTWENENGLSCPELIKAFEDSLKEKEKEKEKSNGSSKVSKKKRQISETVDDESGEDDGNVSKTSKSSSSGRIKDSVESEAESKKTKTNNFVTSPPKTEKVVSGFAQGFVPEKIIGASEVNEELLFLLKWKGSDKAEMVKAKEANVKCPQLVIEFYEQRLIWHSEEN